NVAGASDNPYHGQPNVAGASENNIPHAQGVAGAYQPQHFVPISPVLPGSGLPFPYPHYPVFPYGFDPNQPHPGFVSPEYEDDEYDNIPHENVENAAYPNVPHAPQFTAPAFAAPYPPVPWFPCYYPVSPVLPGSGFHPQVMGAQANMPAGENMPNEPFVGGVEDDDCGCGPKHPPFGYPGVQPHFGWPSGPQNAPYGVSPANYPNQPGVSPEQYQPQSNEMFNRPEEDDS
ncbi:hypothetical protein ABES78_12785, partial [Bacillus gobiensis]